MKSIVEQLKEEVLEIKDLLQEFILDHSKLKRWNYPGSGIITISGDHSWEELKEEGKILQSRLFTKYNHLSAMLKTLISHQPNEALSQFEENEKSILYAIEQKGSTWKETMTEILEETLSSLDKQLELLNYIYDPNSGSVILVPDTNALLTNPDIDKWRFKDIPKFEMLILPTVLAELDELKVTHRVEALRDKAEGIITRIKGFRGRGRLAEGVTLAKGVSTLRSTAVEPDFENTLPWLVVTNKDDRILASFLEIMKQHPHSSVILVTRDINMQNKAEFAYLPYIEPPK